MAWLKKNLLLVVGSVIALALLGYAGFFLFTKKQLESTVTEALNAQTAEYDTLVNSKPHPGNDKVNNIEEAKKQDKELQAFLTEIQKTFVPVDYPTNLDSGKFKLLLDNTIDELQRSADRAGVKLPQNYYFTFSNQKSMMSFEKGTIVPMAAMLAEMREISKVLIGARVLSIDSARRVAVTSQDTPSATPGQSDFWTKKPQTNDLAVTMPYEFTFHCFAGELGSVLEGLYRSPHCFFIKQLVVDTTLSPLLDKGAAEAAQNGESSTTGPNSSMMMYMRRYGRTPGRMGAPPPEMLQPAPTTPTGNILDEKPFRVVMWVEAVRTKDLSKEAKPARPARVPTPADGGEAAPDAAPASN